VIFCFISPLYVALYEEFSFVFTPEARTETSKIMIFQIFRKISASRILTIGDHTGDREARSSRLSGNE